MLPNPYRGQFGKSVKDPEIIQRCRDNEYVFVHAGDRLRRAHRAQLLQRLMGTTFARTDPAGPIKQRHPAQPPPSGPTTADAGFRSAQVHGRAD